LLGRSKYNFGKQVFKIPLICLVWNFRNKYLDHVAAAL